MKELSIENLKNKVCVITGGGGVLGTSMARGLAAAGVKTVILDINEEAAGTAASEIAGEFGIPSYGYKADVLDRQSLEEVRAKILADAGEIEVDEIQDGELDQESVHVN